MNVPPHVIPIRNVSARRRGKGVDFNLVETLLSIVKVAVLSIGL